MFRALTGRLPFEGANPITLIALKLDREAPSLAVTTGDTWPTALERLLAKMMARDRERRFASAAEALAAWQEVCQVMGDSPRRVPRGVVSTDEVAEEAFGSTITETDIDVVGRGRSGR